PIFCPSPDRRRGEPAGSRSGEFGFWTHGDFAMNWTEANQQYLMAALDEVRGALEGRVAIEPATDGRAGSPLPAESGAATSGGAHGVTRPTMPPPALETLCKLFGLSPFERAVLLMCAGMELDSKFAGVCAEANGDPRRDYPSFSLALGALPDAHWSALTPDARLRRWRLIELQPGHDLAQSRLRIAER